MGKRGPKPTPTKVLKLRGSNRVNRRKGEPEPPEAVPELPAWAAGCAAEVWAELLAELGAVGVTTSADGTTTAMLAEALGQYLEARREYEQDGPTVTAESGALYQHPAVGRANKAFERFVKLARDFGLTPASRVGLKAVADGKVSDDGRVKFSLG